MKKTIILILVLILFNLIVLFNVTPVKADIDIVSPYAEQVKNADVLAGAAGLDTSVRIGGVISAVIRGFLGLLGIIFIVLMVYAGYIWMTAAGNEDDIKKSKNLIKAAIIGLIIIIAAYSLTYFVFEALSKSGIGGSGGGLNTSN